VYIFLNLKTINAFLDIKEIMQAFKELTRTDLQFLLEQSLTIMQ